MKFDLHVHPAHSSQGSLSVEEIILHAPQLGLDGVCITGYDAAEVKGTLQEGRQANGIYVLFGIEYATEQGDFLIYGPFDSIEPGLSALELLEFVDMTGGIAIAAHPFKKGREVCEELLQHQLCRFFEEITDRSISITNSPTSNWKSLYAVRSVGGSEACSLAELGRITTVFTEGIENRLDLVDALRRGAFIVERNKSYYGTA